MKNILISLFLIISTVSFSWEYSKKFRYDLGKNNQVLYQSVKSDYSKKRGLFLGMIDNDYLSINLSGDYKMGSIFSVKIYVDDKIVETVRMTAPSEKIISVAASEKIVNSFRRGHEAIIAFSHSKGVSVLKVDLDEFNNGYCKIKNKRYYHGVRNKK